MSDFTERIMVWGADDVLAAWVKWRKTAVQSTGEEAPFEIVVLFEDLVRAIRRDLGHTNKGLQRGDILRLFVNDLDNHMK